MTTDKTYRKRLQDHLKETRDHARRVKSRIKATRRSAEEVSVPGPEAVSDLASGAVGPCEPRVGSGEGPGHMLRGTGEQEKLLKNVKSQYWNEFEEIATYTAIETLADTVGDKETAQARARDPARGGADGEVPRAADSALHKGVAREEIPAALRNGNGGRKRRSSSSQRRTTAKGRSRSTRSLAQHEDPLAQHEDPCAVGRKGRALGREDGAHQCPRGEDVGQAQPRRRQGRPQAREERLALVGSR